MAIVDIEKIQEKVATARIQALIVGGQDNVSYLLNYRNNDMMLCGRNFREMNNVLIIPRKGKSILVEDFPMTEAAERLPFLFVERVERDIPDVLDKLAIVLNQRGLTHCCLGIDMDYIPARWIERLRKDFPEANWVDASRLLTELRLAKTVKEIKFIQKSIAAIEAGFLAVGKDLQIGRRTEEIHFVFAHAVLLAGGLPEHSSPVSIARQWDTPDFPLWFGYSDLVQRDMTFRLDACATYEHYFSDLMRTFYCGPVDAKIRGAYQIGHNFKKVLVGCVRCGMALGELHEEAKDVVKSTGFNGYYGFHGIGLTIHERPFFSSNKRELFTDDKDIVLSENMVFCGEASWGFSGVHGAMGEEDMYLLKKDGPVRLSSLPEEIVSVK